MFCKCKSPLLSPLFPCHVTCDNVRYLPLSPPPWWAVAGVGGSWCPVNDLALSTHPGATGSTGNDIQCTMIQCTSHAFWALSSYNSHADFMNRIIQQNPSWWINIRVSLFWVLFLIAVISLFPFCKLAHLDADACWTDKCLKYCLNLLWLGVSIFLFDMKFNRFQQTIHFLSQKPN